MTDRVFVIAEAGVNHNGSLDFALRLVDAAADAGADAVKFQTFVAERLVTASASKARYQAVNTGADDGQIGMLRALELPPSHHHVILEHCGKRGIEFMSTAFDDQSLAFLLDLGIERIKIPSGDLTAHPLLLQAGRAGKPVILSTGMATLDEIEQALAVLAFAFAGSGEPGPTAFAAAWRSDEGRRLVEQRVVILHCVTDYPAPPPTVNLRAMDAIRDTFGTPVGYSDHSLGIAIPIAAVGRGAAMIEKHVTLSRDLPGPDHKASLEPGELTAMVRAIREVEEALGDGKKRPSAAEAENRPVARRSIFAARPIPQGKPIEEQDLLLVRPGDGLSPTRWWDLLGTPARRDFKACDSLNAQLWEEGQR